MWKKTNKTQHIKQKRWGARDRTITWGLTCSRRGSNYCRQSRDTGMGTRHRTKTNKTQHIKQKRWGARDRTITREHVNPRVIVRSRAPHLFCFICCVLFVFFLCLVPIVAFVSGLSTVTTSSSWARYKQNTTYKTKQMRSTRPYNNPRVNVLTKRK
jgi:hypothetical protein